MVMIIRRQAEERVVRLLNSTDEVPDDSPLEFLDKRLDIEPIAKLNAEAEYLIPEETQEKSKSRGKSVEKDLENVKNTVIMENTENKIKGEEHGKGNDKELERD